MAEVQHIFLSYRSTESGFALKLASDLKNAGVKLWMDRLDGINVGMDWRDAIQQAINTCAAMIAVLSPDYVESEYCKKELNRASTLNRPIFPVLLRPVKPEIWPFVIEGLQYEDFTNWMDEQNYTRSFEKLVRRLREEAAGQVVKVPDAETRYLISLIAELESRRGVIAYVELNAETGGLSVRPRPPEDDEWGFAELVDQPVTIAESTKNPSLTMAEISETFQRFVLVGKPGAGKTTTIRRLALDVARGRLEDPVTKPIPLLLYLPQWANELTPLDFVRAKWPLMSDPEYLLKNGDILLYLDGLNEMGSKRMERAKQLSEWFASSDAPSHAIVTCRIEDYVNELSLDLRDVQGKLISKVPVVMIHELSEDNIRKFVSNHLDDRKDQFLAEILPTHDQKLENVRSLFYLARNPYMLSALLFLYEKSPKSKLPTNFGELFQRLVRALWRREESRGTTRGVQFEQAQMAFAKPAFVMINDDQPVSVPISYAVNLLGNIELMNCGLNASYITSEDGQLRYYHQLMQEYFAAVELQHYTVADKVKTDQSSASYPIFRESNKWDEVVIALSGIVSSPDDLVIDVARKNKVLAVRILESGAKLSADVGIEIVIELLDRQLDWMALLTDEQERMEKHEESGGFVSSAFYSHYDESYDLLTEIEKEFKRIRTKYQTLLIHYLNQKLEHNAGDIKLKDSIRFMAIRILEKMSTPESLEMAKKESN